MKRLVQFVLLMLAAQVALGQLKFSQLPAAGQLTGSESVPMVQGLQTVIAPITSLPVYARTTAEISASVTPLNYSYPVMDALRYGADCTGVSNSATAIQNAISVAAVSGGVVLLDPGCTFNIGINSLTLASNAVIRAYGATVNYSGSGAMVTSSTSATLNYAGIYGGVWNAGSSSTAVFALHSPYRSTFKDVVPQATSTSSTAWEISVNTSGSSNPEGNYNAAFNLFENDLGVGTFGRCERLTGNSSGPVVVTLNRHFNLSCNSAGSLAIAGVDINSWADGNTWIGSRFGLLSATNASGVGVIWNSGTPVSNVGVYNDNFYDLSVDCFGAPSGDARIGAQFNWTKQNVVFLYQSPVCAGGSYATTASTQSTSVYLTNDTIGAKYSIGGQAIFSGTATNDSAATGQVGEFVSNAIGSGSAISLTTSTPANITSISLTAGDWDVWGNIAFSPGATTTVSNLIASIGTTSASVGGFSQAASQLPFPASFVPNLVISVLPPAQRLSLSATTTVYLVANSSFATSTLSAYGSLNARRRR